MTEKQEHMMLFPLNERKLPYIVETIGINNNQEKVQRPAGYPFFHWIQTIEGEGIFKLSGQRTIRLPKNTGALFFPHYSHSYQSTQNWKTAYITFEGDLIYPLLEEIKINRSSFFYWSSEDTLNQLIHHFLKNKKKNHDINSLEASAFIYHFLLNLSSKRVIEENHSFKKEIPDFSALLTWLKKDLSNPELGIDDMAGYMAQTRRTFYSQFQLVYHVSPYSFLINLRIQEAKRLLLENRFLAVKEIGERVGFRSPSHFVSTFKKHVGVTPNHYRS